MQGGCAQTMRLSLVTSSCSPSPSLETKLPTAFIISLSKIQSLSDPLLSLVTSDLHIWTSAVLRLRFSCLECFSIRRCRYWLDTYSWGWNGFSSELKDASTHKTLCFEGMTHVPTSFFQHIVHISCIPYR